jgi:hypothetical protein
MKTNQTTEQDSATAVKIVLTSLSDPIGLQKCEKS